jgi:hypothetical protein
MFVGITDTFYLIGGFFKGVGTGIAGVVVKPVTGKPNLPHPPPPPLVPYSPAHHLN